MPDDVPLAEEPHVALLRLGLTLATDAALKRRLSAAIFARGAGTPVADEKELIKAVEKLIDDRPI